MGVRRNKAADHRTTHPPHGGFFFERKEKTDVRSLLSASATAAARAEKAAAAAGPGIAKGEGSQAARRAQHACSARGASPPFSPPPTTAAPATTAAQRWAASDENGARELIEQGDRLFSRRASLLSLWQTIAEQFYPLRADFTGTRSAGDEFASHLMTGRPLLVHRELSNAFSSMLRPRGKVWFRARTNNDAINEDSVNRQWLDGISVAMSRAMYDSRAQFVRATKQGDADFAAFGQTVISVDPNRELNGLLFRNWHLRDCAWCENAENAIDVFHRDTRIEARDYLRLFPERGAEREGFPLKEPYKEIRCRHIVVPSDDYDLEGVKNRQRFPYVSITIDIENSIVLEEVARRRLGYVIPRWVTISGSQYAYSPATVIALPDARMLQQISLTLLEAGQKAVDPPLKVTKDVVGAVNTYPGGLTWVDEEYDERLGPAIEPIIGGNPPALSWGEPRREDRGHAGRYVLSVEAVAPARRGRWRHDQMGSAAARGGIYPRRAAFVRADGGGI